MAFFDEKKKIKKNNTKKSFMTLTKKTITLKKTKNLIENYPILLCFQHNNLNVNEWNLVRLRLQEIPNVKLVFLQNKTTSSFLDQHFHSQKNQFSHLLQGPCLFVGCDDTKILDFFRTSLESSNKLVFLGGVYYWKLFTHLDFQKINQLDGSVYHQLIHTLSLGDSLAELLVKNLDYELTLLNPFDVFLDVLSSFRETLNSVKKPQN